MGGKSSCRAPTPASRWFEDSTPHSHASGEDPIGPQWVAGQLSRKREVGVGNPSKANACSQHAHTKVAQQASVGTLQGHLALS
jgi:hypothetical protein